MSGGSNDDAVLCISHATDRIAVIDLIEKQSGGVPFNPRDAVSKFAHLMKEYGLSDATADAYAGNTFRSDFAAQGITLHVARKTASEYFESAEVAFNANEIELLDVPKLVEQFVCLVWRGSKIDHEPGGHNDWANACAIACHLARDRGRGGIVQGPIILVGGSPDPMIAANDPWREYNTICAGGARG